MVDEYEGTNYAETPEYHEMLHDSEKVFDKAVATCGKDKKEEKTTCKGAAPPSL